jgi:hypothetical protein
LQSNKTTLDVAPAACQATEEESAEGSAAHTFEVAFRQGGPSRFNVMVAFEAALRALPRTPQREDDVRDVAKAAALCAARSHGNIIETGRVLLGSIDELGAKLSLDVRKCKDHVMLGLAEGACQIGPIVYGRFLDIASEYRDNADDWIAKNKRRGVVLEALALPVIVPFEEELTLSARPFKEPDPAAPPAPLQAPTSTAVAPAEPPPPDDAPEEALPVEWSRPKGKGFFRRLSDVMGSLFGRK